MKQMTRIMVLCLAICMFSCVLLTSTASAAPLTAPDGTTDFFDADAEEAARNPYLRWSVGWNQSGTKWYYLDNSGKPVTGWLAYQGYWYHLDNSGYAREGFHQIGGLWYYFRTYDNMTIPSRIITPVQGPQCSMICGPAGSSGYRFDGYFGFLMKSSYMFNGSGACINK